ncbi:penicillin-binding protein 2 [Sulfidibacter corallicola]|uniref:Penicillin-binding protein 2 n=1 Tax=Sulfidibacter corallicola TaxID=2818388 RepID=A0A8A4TGC5_SULCO|nr:penicillin-binding protein 2 [Sulfidibacter corallicola]QTD47778.1 penicillin-binding protein 2 [Sulfidibacter corallicola]
MRLAPTPLAFQGRIFFLRWVVIFSFLMVLGGYYRIQILNQERYEELGESYRIKKRRIKATRGLIYDRAERLVTQNMPTYDLLLRRDEMEEPWRRLKPRIAEFLEAEEETLQRKYDNRSHLLSQPVTLIENISFSESMRIRRNIMRYPGLAIETTEKRHYTYGRLFPHVLGYVSEASKEALRKNPRLRLGDVVGKSGIELAYDQLLTGTDGERTIVADHRGVYHSSEITTAPQPGGDVVLTLDFELQKLAFETLEGRTGSVVMMDVKTGEVLVYVSSPTFDLNMFTEGLSQEQWQELLKRPGNPLLNRPLQGAYAPGSVFKVVTALSALQNGKITPNTTYFCNGEYKLHNHVFHCHKRGGHGHVDVSRALQGSCNVYFYNVARDLDIEQLAKTAHELGLGETTGIDLIGEKSGLVPTPRWKKQRSGKIWYPGETLSVSIGQGSLQTTPLQLLSMMSTVASEGQVIQPHLLLKSRLNETVVPNEGRKKHISTMEREYFRLVKQALWRVVNKEQGTGSRAQVPGFDVCGKTGTAQLITFSSEAEHKIDKYKNAWFAGFAPRDEAEVAIVVLVEHAGAGGAKAAPIAKILLEAYQARKNKKVDPT